MEFIIVAAQTILAVVAVIVLVRLNGLRSFSKMSSFDFGLTVAAGSVLATMMTSSDSPWPELVALATLFLTRFVVSKVRQRYGWAVTLTDNAPLMLMYDGVVLEKNLPLARVTQSDLRGKLREANAIALSQIRAVVFEPTGDISVLHGDTFDCELLRSVSWGAEDIPTPVQTELSKPVP
ncbi:DUF421 domain-containing protein [Parasulfitobacter algicola]|uniref:DUF421 domain-containing protein n=1 Tax=Parasulfitobacter algicola TaxID=2614809 RepID=A0ABX2ISN1_9RHOB|nr:YetF domain-containing protein [Sulfitobacter algicola]NSX55325.1 DUF421 domain-containing protein [Sulfitobacter algicola]